MIDPCIIKVLYILTVLMPILWLWNCATVLQEVTVTVGYKWVRVHGISIIFYKCMWSYNYLKNF